MQHLAFDIGNALLRIGNPKAQSLSETGRDTRVWV